MKVRYSIVTMIRVVIFRLTLFYTSFPCAWLLNQNIVSTLSCGSSVDGKLFSLLLVSMPLGTYRLLWAPEISFFVSFVFCFAWYPSHLIWKL